MSLIVVITKIFTLVLIITYNYFTKTFNYWTSKNIKGPKPILFFGNYKDIALRKKPKFKIYNEIYKQYPKEKVVGIYLMTTPILLIRDLDIVKQILMKDFAVFPDRGTRLSKKGFGENLIHCDGDTWKKLKNLFTVLFTPSKIKNKIPLLVERGDRFVDYVKSVTIKDPEQDAYELAYKYGVATTIVNTYGWDVDTFHEDSGWYKILDEHFINTYWQEVGLLFPNLLTKFNLSMITKETINICHNILKTCLTLESVSGDKSICNVKNVIINLKAKKQIGEQVDTNSMIEVTDDLLAGQLWVFHMAGYINSTLTMTYAMYQLACNPSIQQKLRHEVDNTMEKCKGTLTYESLKDMNYLRMVFEETLRMYPPSQVLSRNAIRNVKLDGTDLIIDKGTTIIISPYSIQHDEQYYVEPEKFNPERFSSDNPRNPHPCTFLSFGAGYRGCPGSQYSRLQFGIGLTKLLYNFRLETSKNTCSNLTYDPYHMLMKPKPGSQYSRLQFGIGLTKLLYNFRLETSKNTCSNLTYDPYHMLMKPKPGIKLKFIPRAK